MPLENLLILGLATWRISNLLVNEDGPWQLLARLRYTFGVRHNEASEPYALNDFSELWLCVWCISPWIGLLLTLAYWRWSNVTILISLPLALSAMAAIFDLMRQWANGSS